MSALLEDEDSKKGLSRARVEKYFCSGKQGEKILYVTGNGEKYFSCDNLTGPSIFMKSNGDPELDIQEYRLYKGLSEKGVMVPESVYAEGRIVTNDAGTSLKQYLDSESRLGTDAIEIQRNLSSLINKAFNSNVLVNHVAEKILSDNEKAYADSLESKALAGKFNISEQEAKENYFLLRMMEAVPSIRPEDPELYAPIAAMLEESFDQFKTFNTDRNPSNVFIGKDEEIKHADFNTHKYDLIHIPLLQLMDEYMPNRGAWMVNHDNDSIFCALANRQAIEGLRQKIESIGDSQPSDEDKKNAVIALEKEFASSAEKNYGLIKDSMIDIYLNSLNNSRTMSQQQEISKDEFLKHLEPARVYYGIRKAYRALQKIATADSYQDIYFIRNEVVHYLGIINESLRMIGLKQGDEKKYYALRQKIVHGFINTLTNGFKTEVQQDTMAWINHDMQHFRNRAVKLGLNPGIIM